jgi:hypothetical protein
VLEDRTYGAARPVSVSFISIKWWLDERTITSGPRKLTLPSRNAPPQPNGVVSFLRFAVGLPARRGIDGPTPTAFPIVCAILYCTGLLSGARASSMHFSSDL